MAYNLQTLITILEQILDPQQTSRIDEENKPQLNSLLEKAISLQQTLEQHSLPTLESRMVDRMQSRNLIRRSIKWLKISLTTRGQSLERQIRDAAHKAEDIIESRMVDRIISASLTEEVLISFSAADLQQVNQELDSAMQLVVKFVEVEDKKTISSTSRGTSSSSGGAAAASLNPKSAKASSVVGFDEDLMELKERLVGMRRNLEIIPIVGMGGAGKTTLARNLYEDPLIVSHFIARAWVTVSQDHNMRSILLSLVSCITEKEVVDGDVSVLKDSLYKSLYGRRYLIVLDDIWSTQAWDEMSRYFPDNKNGSRVVITTRESNVATHANTHSQHHAVQLLSEPASWNLLCQIVFGEEDCPFELESIGRKIASDCGGLPLAITVIGALLSKVGRSKDIWENIGENVRGAIAKSEEDERYSSILSLSYNHLPNYLKPCFLYMGGFPEDYEIKGSTLICYWIAEGFIKSNRGEKSLEEVAEEYLKGLVERNLFMARRNKSNISKPMSYVIHDVLRDLCIRKAEEDNFLHATTRGRGMISKLRRVSSEYVYRMEDTHAELMSLARSFRCTASRRWWPSPVVVRYISSISNLLRVLDIMYQMSFEEFPTEILQLVNLRFLGLKCKRLSVGISRLVNLQILINRCSFVEYVPSEIWKMFGLRYVKFSASYFKFSGVYFWSEDDNIEMVVEMNKLHTIKSVVLTESLLERGFLQAIPNIKNLGITLENQWQVIDFSHLHKLETLLCKYYHGKDWGFSLTLRKLNLYLCSIYPHMATTLCGLPNLEVLKIRSCWFILDTKVKIEKWELREGEEFTSLQYLQLDDLSLVHWRADETNFPKLRHLLLRKCYSLEEIPSGIGEIPTLELIEMKECSAYSVESAKQIVKVQHSEYDNYALQLRIRRW